MIIYPHRSAHYDESGGIPHRLRNRHPYERPNVFQRELLRPQGIGNGSRRLTANVLEYKNVWNRFSSKKP